MKLSRIRASFESTLMVSRSSVIRRCAFSGSLSSTILRQSSWIVVISNKGHQERSEMPGSSVAVADCDKLSNGRCVPRVQVRGGRTSCIPLGL
jgi:hypothetical protein